MKKNLLSKMIVLVVVAIMSVMPMTIAFAGFNGTKLIINAPDTVGSEYSYGYEVAYQLIGIHGKVDWKVNYTTCSGSWSETRTQSTTTMVTKVSTNKAGCNITIKVVAKTAQGRVLITGSKTIKVIENTFAYTMTGNETASVGEMVHYKANPNRACRYSGISVWFMNDEHDEEHGYKAFNFKAEWAGEWPLQWHLVCNYRDSKQGIVAMGAIYNSTTPLVINP